MDDKKLKKITLSGHLGSGKTVVGKILSKKYRLKYYSTGAIQREIAVRKGITTLALNRLAESNREIDDTIDNFSRELNHKKENFILDSRLAWYFIDKAFKVFLKVDKEEAARRIMRDTSRKSEKYQNLEEAIRSIQARRQSEQDRFFRLYGVKLYDKNNYHLVIDTTHQKPEEIVKIITQYWSKFLSGENFPNVIDQ